MYRRRRKFPVAGLVIIGIFIGVGVYVIATLNGSSDTISSVTATPFLALLPPENTSQLSLTPITPASLVNVPAVDTTVFIPSLGIYAPVITAIIRDRSWDISNLGTKVGYLQGTGWLGDNSNIVLSGHVEMSDGRKGIFASLPEVQIGDEVVVSQNGENYHYVVRELKYVDPSDLSVLYPTESETLTLITCSDYDFWSNVYETRLVVIAAPV